MSHYTGSKKNSGKNSFKSHAGQGGNKKKSPILSKKNGSSVAHSSNSRGGKRKMPQFDPTPFVKKVEEQAAAQAYFAKNTFSDFALENQLKINIQKKGYITPTPIQDQAIPYVLEGKDVIGTANTGTGKTAAFLIPLVNNALVKKTDRVLIIAPTRELAVQIREELKSFAGHTGLTSGLCIGGANINVQMRALKSNPVFVIGTPGRLLDLENNNGINFSHYSSIVLDEVDRMLDMGFIRDIRYIIARLPKNRHSLFFSATLSAEVKALMNSFLHNPISVSVKTRQSAENVNQQVIKVGENNKIEMLHDLLIKPDFKKVLIFLHTKRSVDKLAKELVHRGFTVAAIHGNKSQPQRNKALQAFKTGAVTILLATDVVARGIDINDISHVINFDLPQSYEDYIHRIGRTGRAEKVGQAISFV